MKIKKIIFFSFLPTIRATLFLLLSLNGNTQTISGKLTAMTERDGLSSNNVNNIVVDKQGYIWVSTYNGLARYDGYEFKKFYSNPNDPNAINGMIAYSSLVDQYSNIWVGTNPSFIEKYNPDTRTFQTFNLSLLLDKLLDKPLLYGYVITSMCEDKNGRIYFGIDGIGPPLKCGLVYKDANSDSLKMFQTPDKNTIPNVFIIKKDNADNIWVYSYTGLFIINKDSSVQQLPFSKLGPLEGSNYLADFVFTEDGHAWFLSDDLKLIEYDMETSKHTTWKSPYTLSTNGNRKFGQRLYKDESDKIWIGTDSGIQFFDTKTKEFSIFDNGVDKDLKNMSVKCFAKGDFGDLWIGTLNNGLVHFENKPGFKSYTSESLEQNNLSPGWISIITEAHDGKIWMPNNSGINVLDNSTGIIKKIPASSIPDALHYLTAFWENSPDEFYAASNNELHSYSVKTGEVKKIILPGLPEEIAITKYLLDSRGNEWICSRNGLFKRGKNAKQFEKYDVSQLNGSTRLSIDMTGIFESRKHGLWIITNNGLFLYHYDSDKIDRHGFDKSRGEIFITQDINSFYEDSTGTAWVGLWQGGLSKYNPETGGIKNYTTDDGLPSMGVQSIIGDDKNRTIWLSSFNGISRFDPQTEQFNNFSLEDGIQGSIFADGSFLRTTDGNFIFGGVNGITIFNPDDFNIKYIPPKVFLTDIKLFNKPIVPKADGILDKALSETESITLNYNQNNLTIDFVAIHYSNPQKNKYAYILENYDNQWREVSLQNEAFYPILPPGKYVFRVKAANDKGVWNEEGAKLNITIKPPWWQTWWADSFYGLLLLLAIWATHRFLRERTIRIEREKTQKRELEQAKEIEKAYTELKSTQAQLIQSEKMASLGELTAGIAHEIQNPLNFVNNFSDLNKELIDELKEELAIGNRQSAEEIANDIKDNEQKINHHGKRAEAIVKGMLQHSRTSTGQKELTDINALADEYLRLSYHGLRAKDKSFNADFKTEFDESLPKINVIPQDIGRVLLNLINNAFYAVSEKSKELTPQPPEGGTEKSSQYKPGVTVTTSHSLSLGEGRGEVRVTVKDNGNGIPSSIKDKIFQPFFTTKPTGQGTGLGLSLSYDIVKAHGGEIRVESKEGEGTEFIILLPMA